ncbi:MAG: hypothetical protein ACJAX4_002866 [Clostridium sp.]|jgi:hypothetical protein
MPIIMFYKDFSLLNNSCEYVDFINKSNVIKSVRVIIHDINAGNASIFYE